MKKMIALSLAVLMLLGMTACADSQKDAVKLSFKSATSYAELKKLDGQTVAINGYMALGMEKQDASTAASMSLVALSALLTGLSLYDNIAKYAGAGTLVPITGFANAVASAAVEYKTEGFILGVGAKMFTIAGPVIVYGVSASVVYGLIYWVTTLF